MDEYIEAYRKEMYTPYDAGTESTRRFMKSFYNEGYERGSEDGTKKAINEITERMLQENINIHCISRVTNLSIDEINNLK